MTRAPRRRKANADDRTDAERWRALFAGRVRIITTTPQPHQRLPKDARYIMLEMTYGGEEALTDNWLSSEALVAYADYIRENRHGH